MTLSITITEFAARYLDAEAISRLVEAEALRLWHIERSTPKVKSNPVSSLGRRLLTMFEKVSNSQKGLTPLQETNLALVKTLIAKG